MKWNGVMPAITTPFDENGAVDHVFMGQHAQWMIENGCTGIVALGSLGEAATLSFEEKLAILKNLVAKVSGRAPVIAAISALSTHEAVRLAQAAEQTGCAGLMILPPYVYQSDWRETKVHIGSVLCATALPSMLYNNPVAYGTDFLPEQVRELMAAHGNLEAIKESSTDVRRVTAIRSLSDTIQIMVGVDDAIVEALAAGAIGWVAGLVNAFPRESVALLEAGLSGDRQQTFELYRWFLPLLRMDTVPKFVQLIKWVQQELGVGSAKVRAPRLEIEGAELSEAKAVLAHALAARPKIAGAVPFPVLAVSGR
jgi:4-hydroxy-tetrahydrodipicolinate synthase